MLPFVFAALCGACIGLWWLGAPVWLVFLLSLAAWCTFYLLVYPKIRTYKAAMGIDDRLDSWEATGWAWVRLHLAGFKVLAIGFLTSMVPFLGSAAEWLNGQKLDFFFDPKDPKAQQTVMFVIGALVFVTPFLTSWLHSKTAATAAGTEPKVESKIEPKE